MLNEEIINEWVEEMLNDEFFVKVIKALILLNIIIIVVAIVMFFWNITDGTVCAIYSE